MLRLKSEGHLSNSVRRAAYPHLRQLYDRIHPAIWAQDDRQESNILDDEQRRIHQLQRDSERRRQEHSWFVASLNVLERDSECAPALATAASRRGDNDVPEGMKRPAPMSEMAKLYAQFPDTQYHNPNIEPPTHSRLQLRDPAVPQKGPPTRFGEGRHTTSVHPVPAAPPRPDVLSMSALSKKLLPQHLQIPDDGPTKAGYAVGRSNREGETLRSGGTVALPDPNKRW
jgi:hypothetical protein